METFCWLVPLMLYADFLCTGLFLHFFCKNFEELNDLHGTFQLMSLFEAIFHHPGGCWSPLIRTSTYHINDSVVIFFFSIHEEPIKAKVLGHESHNAALVDWTIKIVIDGLA